MRIFSFKEEITYTTQLSKKEVLRRLYDNIDQSSGILNFERMRGLQKPYKGIVHSNGFRMKRKNTSRSEFIPEISGKIIDEKGVITIKVVIDIESIIPIIGSMIVGIAIVCLFFLPEIEKISLDTSHFLFIIPLTLFLCVAPFWGIELVKSEASDCKEYLQKILQAEIVK